MLVTIVGPTASGKTSLALRLARKLGAEIVSADSRQVYKHLDIGTAKPAREEMALVPHHLVDVVLPGEDFSLADYQRLALAAIREIVSRGRIPLLVGGTGLYVRAVTEGYLLPLAPPDPEFREKLYAEAVIKERGYLHRELLERDPITAARLHPNDLHRIVRALEVIRATGRPFSEFSRRSGVGPLDLPVFKMGMALPRDLLYRQIEERVDEMIRRGFRGEVEELLRRGFREKLLKIKILGYEEMVHCIEGRLGLPEAVALIKRRTRHYAKRQLTWFRKEKDVEWFRSDQAGEEEILENMLKLISTRCDKEEGTCR